MGLKQKPLAVFSFIIIISISIIGIVSLGFASGANCISLKLAKTSYLPQETVQLEIDAPTIKEILTSDIFLYKGETRIPVTIFLTKVTNTKYFAWFDLLPGGGNYSVKVRGNCPDGFYVSEINFKVETTIASKYLEFKPLVKDKFLSLDLDEHLLSAMALAHDDKTYEQALGTFVNRSDSCLKINCSTFFNALTLMAFKDSLIRQKMINNIEAAQSYVNKGSWKLNLNSSLSQECNLSINNETSNISLVAGSNSLDLDFSNVTDEIITVKVSCNSSVNGNIVYTYKQFSKSIALGEGQAVQTVLNNRGCFVSNFNNVFTGNCDKESTVFALMALAKTANFNANSTNHIVAISWLNRNANSVEEKAVVYYITSDLDALTWLLGSQTGAGWWPKSGDYQPDIRATSIAILAVKSHVNSESSSEFLEAIAKGERWLLGQFSSSSAMLKDKAIILAYAFQAKDIEPVITIWPGIVKTDSLGSFSLILNNKGTQTIMVNAGLLNSTTQFEIDSGTIKNVKFNVPLFTTTDGRSLVEILSLDYKTKISDKIFSYSIPIVIFTQKSVQEQTNGTINASEEEINESKQEEIINETQEETKNKTTEINQSLLQYFRFVERNITKTINVNEPFTTTVRISNQMDRDITGLLFGHSTPLTLMGGSITINPSYIDKLEKDETRNITISFMPARVDNFSGEIEVTANYDSQKIKASLPVKINVIGLAIELKDCSEMGGKICNETNENCTGNLTTSKESYACCIPADSCKKVGGQGTTIALIIIVVVVIVLLIILYVLKKKPKKEMKEFLEETSRAYEKRFQRPPGITRV
ncbi:MAG: hypothetical protein ACPLXC_00565 [Candidatus Pacearchaeota archaeon]